MEEQRSKEIVHPAMGKLKNGAVVYYWSGTYERIIKDWIVEYSSQIDMYWLKESEDWFPLGSLYTNLKTLKKSL